MTTENMKQVLAKESEAGTLLAKMNRRDKLLDVAKRGRRVLSWSALNIHWAIFGVTAYLFISQVIFAEEIKWGNTQYLYIGLGVLFLFLLYQNANTNQRLDALVELLEEENLLKVNMDKSKND